MVVVAVNHLLDVFVVVVDVASVLSVAVTVADTSNGCVVWRGSLLLDHDTAARPPRNRSTRRHSPSGLARAGVGERQPRDIHGPGLCNRHRFTPSSPGRTAPKLVLNRSIRSVRKTHCSQGPAMQREKMVEGWRRAWVAQARDQSLNRVGPCRRRSAPKVRRADTKRWLGGRERRSLPWAKAPGKPASEWRGGQREVHVSLTATPSASAPSEPCRNGKRPVCCAQATRAYGTCGLVAAVRQLRRSGDGEIRVAGQLQPERGMTAQQVCRSANWSDRQREAGDAVMLSAASSLVQSFGQGCRLGLGVTSQCAPCASGNVPRRRPSGERDAQSLRSVQRGRPFGELGSILCGQSRVQERDPPAFSAGKTGKSLNT